jgi:hypothetical protein
VRWLSQRVRTSAGASSADYYTTLWPSKFSHYVRAGENFVRHRRREMRVDITFSPDDHLSINVAPRMTEGFGQFPGEIVWKLLETGLL